MSQKLQYILKLIYLYLLFLGFERRRCETSGKWEPEAPICKETLCKPLEKPANGSMILTTLRIGGRATFTCNEGFSLQGDDDIECLSSGSWSSWPPTCLEVDCGQPYDLENGRLYLTNGTTNIGSIVEYHCFPEFERHGDFQRVCLEDGYWSGPEPKCNKPTTRRPISILSDNTVDGTHNIRAGNRDDPLKDGGSSVGLIIGIVLGLILAIGLMFIGVYFCRKQHALAAKPPAPYRDRNANGGVSMVGGYASTGVYHTASNGPPQPGGNGGLPPRTAGINTRAPPPPIQMYSMDEAAHTNGSAMADLSGQPTINNNGPVSPAPIYDTINDDHSSGGSGYAHSGSDRYTPSTFKNGGSSFHAYNNSGMNHDYDTPEGSEPNKSSNTVTINGIAV